MNIKQKLSTLPWKLIIALGLFALVRPIIKICGVIFEYEVPAAATLSITAITAIVWVGTVVKLKISQPVLVLAMSGAVYGVVSILMAAVIQLSVPELRDNEARVPILLTVGLVATTVYNFAYGALLGFAARGILSASHKK